MSLQDLKNSVIKRDAEAAGINFDDEGTSSTVNSTSEVIEGDSSVPF